MLQIPSIDFIFKKRDFRFQKNDKDQVMIWDVIRKKYVIYTPEEHVRQHIVHALIHEYKIPQSWISIEKSVLYNGMRKRYDILVYRQAETPHLIIECKAPEVEITQATLLQVSMYQNSFPASYIMISNGRTSYLAEISENDLHWQDAWTFSTD